MPFDQYYVKIDEGKFLRGAWSEVNDTEEALSYTMLGHKISMDLLWGDSIKEDGELSHDAKLQCDGRTAPFYVFSNITELTIIGGTYIACDPHHALSSMVVVNGLGVPNLFSLFSAITCVDIQGGEFTTVYADDPKAFASIIESQYREQEHNFGVFQNITQLSIIGGTFISVRSSDPARAFPASADAMPDFHMFRHITTIDVIGATFNVVIPPSMHQDATGEGLQPQTFFDRVTSVTLVSSRFFYVTLQDYIQRWERTGAAGVTINTDSNNKTKVSMRNVGNGDINFHIHYGEVSLEAPPVSHPESSHGKGKMKEPLHDQSQSSTPAERRREMRIAVARLLALMHDLPATSSGGNSKINNNNKDYGSNNLTAEPVGQEHAESLDGSNMKQPKSHYDHGIPRNSKASQQVPGPTPLIRPHQPRPTKDKYSAEKSSPIPPEHLVTMHPLLLPSDGKPKETAQQLATLYFAATLHAADIPEFTAEYVSHDGRYTSILLIMDNAFDADGLRLAWDRKVCENLRVKALANVTLYRGDMTARILAQVDRDAALAALESYSIHD